MPWDVTRSAAGRIRSCAPLPPASTPTTAHPCPAPQSRRAVHDMVNADLLRSVSNVLALPNFSLSAADHSVLHAVDPVHVMECVGERAGVSHVRSDDFCS